MTGVFYVTLRYHGMERTRNKSQHRKFNSGEEIIQPFLPGLELATFRSRVRCSTSQLSRLPILDFKSISTAREGVVGGGGGGETGRERDPRLWEDGVKNGLIEVI